MTQTLCHKPRRDDTSGKRGLLTIYCGCMFAGKTTALIKAIEPVDKRRVVVFKPAMDTRYATDAIVSHGGRAMPAQAVTQALQMIELVGADCDVVGLDEAHFFDAALSTVIELLVGRGMDVLATSLDRDSWGRPFPLVERLIASADNTSRLYATCAKCDQQADRTQRLTPVINGAMVGGAESYEPRCETCWQPPPESPPSVK